MSYSTLPLGVGTVVAEFIVISLFFIFFIVVDPSLVFALLNLEYCQSFGSYHGSQF